MQWQHWLTELFLFVGVSRSLTLMLIMSSSEGASTVGPTSGSTTGSSGNTGTTLLNSNNSHDHPSQVIMTYLVQHNLKNNAIHLFNVVKTYLTASYSSSDCQIFYYLFIALAINTAIHITCFFDTLYTYTASD